jgi:type IV fimbrial biogenesis protein FimT
MSLIRNTTGKRTGSNAGFTMIELLVVIVIVGIGMSLAVPSFQGMLARNRLATQSNELLIAINLARSEANRVGGIVSVQAATPVADDEFGAGWCVVLGNPGDCSDPVMRHFPALVGLSTLAQVEGLNSIQFNGLGALSGTTNALRNFDMCLDGQLGRRIQVSLIGRAKISRQAEASDLNPPPVQPAC